MLKKLLIILSVCLFTMANGEIQKTESEDYQFSNQTYPESYEIKLLFQNFNSNLRYTGFNTINIKVLEETDSIILHSSNINITKVTPVQGLEGITLNYTLDSERELLVIKRLDKQKFESNKIIAILIQFTGGIQEFPTTQGVHRGMYKDEKVNLTKYFLASHTLPNNARRVFPCYDEPQFKSVFILKISHLSQYRTISNMDPESDEVIGPLVTTTFKQTPLIPAYLLNFFISDFKSNELEIIQSQITIRAFSQPGQIEEANFGFLTGIIAYNSIENYFNATHALKKLDQVVLPEYNFGGIENQGIIFYDEDLFLYDRNKDTVSRKELVSRNIVNEICQTFIGSSLTHDYGFTSWLNKGLCKFYEYHMNDLMYPEMKLSNIFAEVMQAEMNLDSSLTTPPLSSGDIRQSYIKAASVIRMFNHALSEETFRRGLQIYIKKCSLNPEGIAKPKHFYDALQLALNDSRIDVTGMFETWELQAGYPIVNVTRNYNGNNIRFTQKRFTNDIKEGIEHNELWSIPITYSSKSNSNSHTPQQSWMHRRETEVNVEGLTANDYILVNLEQTGYYRVMYDEANWVLIAKELNEGEMKNILPNTRAMLIDDAGKFMQMDILSVKIFLEFINYLQRETDYMPLTSARNNLSYMRRMLNDGSSKLYNEFQKFLQTLIKNVFETYGVLDRNNEHQQKHIRNIAINWACQAHLPACLTQTEDLFNRGIMKSEVTISADHRATIMCNGAIKGGVTTYGFLWESYMNSNQASEKSLMLKTIGCIESYEILKDYINRYKSVTKDEWFTVIQSVYLNGPIGMNVAMEFLDVEFENLTKFIKEHNAFDSLESIFRGIADRIITNEMSVDFVNLMKKYEISKSTTDSLNAIITENLEWIRKNSPIIDDFLNSARMMTVSLTVILFGFFVPFFC